MVQENNSSPDTNSFSPVPNESLGPITKKQVVIIYKRRAQPDEYVLALLDRELRLRGHSVFFDRYLTIGARWEREIEAQIKNADVVIPLLSPASVTSAVAGELRITEKAANTPGKKLLILPVRVGFEEALPDHLAAVLDPLQYAFWNGPLDDGGLIRQLLESIDKFASTNFDQVPLEQVGGAVPLGARFYIARQTDGHFLDALKRRDSCVLIKGAHQMGKSSLLARGLQAARGDGATVLITDFQTMNTNHFESLESLFLGIAEAMADHLDLEISPQEVWKPRIGASINFRRYLQRHVLSDIQTHMVWALDEVDRLFTCSFGGEVFGFFRSLHGARALEPDGPWTKFTMAISYATEPHVFISDSSQSPFNIGTLLELGDFTLEQVSDLNRRHGSPLRDDPEVSSFYRLLGGHPFLVRKGMHEMVNRNLTLASFHQIAYHDEGPFGDHLRRFLVLLSQDSELNELFRDLLNGRRCRSTNGFFQLKSAGLLVGASARDARIRCQLYENYLGRHL